MKRITAVLPDGSTNTAFNGEVGPLQFIDGVIELDTDEHDIYVGYCETNTQFLVEHDIDGPAQDPRQLKGKALDAALDAAGLSKEGKADEKRARLVEHLEAQVPVVPAIPEVVDERTDTEREADEQAQASRVEA